MGTSSYQMKWLFKMGLFLCLFSLLPRIWVTVACRIFSLDSLSYHLLSTFLNHHLGPDKNNLIHTLFSSYRLYSVHTTQSLDQLFNTLFQKSFQLLFVFTTQQVTILVKIVSLLSTIYNLLTCFLVESCTSFLCVTWFPNRSFLSLPLQRYFPLFLLRLSLFHVYDHITPYSFVRVFYLFQVFSTKYTEYHYYVEDSLGI